MFAIYTFVESNDTNDNKSILPLPDVGKYLLPLICLTFDENEAVGGVGPG
jgi:hypothetical protein